MYVCICICVCVCVDEKVLLYGASVDEASYNAITNESPKTILGHRDGAILISCGTGAVWISHLKRLNTTSKKYIKLPATQVLASSAMMRKVPHLDNADNELTETKFGAFPASFQEIFYWRWQNVAFLWFDFYNGAMTTSQCQRLSRYLQHLEQ